MTSRKSYKGGLAIRCYTILMSYRYISLAIFIILIFAITLFLMGQPLICKCGDLKIWHGDVQSSENSQHIIDWYTFSHVIHGFVFYWLFTLMGKRWRWSFGLVFLLALLAEVSWEIVENTDWVINYYRENTISLGYYGDSVINSVFDLVWMIVGFFLAWRWPVWAIVMLAVAMELVVAYFIRDNLTLNILMFIYPFKSVLRWQLGT